MQTGSQSVLAEDPAADKVSVLVVEDSPEFQLVLHSVLSSEGFDVQVAGSGEVAIERARISMPDVVVLDVVLPGMDGLDVCRELREFSDAYVVMLSGRDEEVDKLVGLAVGADDFGERPARGCDQRDAAALGFDGGKREALVEGRHDGQF